MQAIDRVDSVLDARVDGRSVAITRILIGIAAFFQMIDTAGILSDVLDDTRLQLPLFAWLPVVSSDWLPAYLLLWGIAAVLFAIGWHTWTAGTVLSLVLSYSLVIDQQSYSNHVYLLILVVVLLTLAQSGSRFSIDARLNTAQETVPGWPVVLLKWQMSIVYCFAAISKVNLLYISGAIMAANMRHGWAVSLPEAWIQVEVMLPLAVVSIFTELFLAFAFWSPRHRPVAVFVGVAMHTIIALTFPIETALALTIFGIIMVAIYVQFLDIDLLKAKLTRSCRPPIESPSTVG